MSIKERFLNMSFITNLIAILFIVVGYYSPVYQRELYTVGVFAFSGAITNWLAIYMLFEKVPGLYGSGVIPSRFEEFKAGIKRLIMDQFFTRDNLERFLQNMGSSSGAIKWDRVGEAIDYKKVFYALIDLLKESPLGGFLMMLGGDVALSAFEKPFAEKMKEVVIEIVSSESFKEKLKELSDTQGVTDYFLTQVESIVENRLNELTPKLVKDIIQDMIRKHLGWLVVWGGVFGGLIGFLTTFI